MGKGRESKGDETEFFSGRGFISGDSRAGANGLWPGDKGGGDPGGGRGRWKYEYSFHTGIRDCRPGPRRRMVLLDTKSRARRRRSMERGLLGLGCRRRVLAGQERMIGRQMRRG